MEPLELGEDSEDGATRSLRFVAGQTTRVFSQKNSLLTYPVAAGSCLVT